MTTFQRCIANGSYDVVSPGEVCTLETARLLGISDATDYFVKNNEFDDVMTFNETRDGKDGRTTQLCSYTSNATVAYKSCTIEHGLGFARKMSEPSKCITFSCPPGFESTGTNCKKPLEDFTISKLSRCDERWSDWFIVPNYHLGNKFFSPEPGKCYKPCIDYHVPQYAVDPVDESGAGFNAKEKMDRCVARNEYMSGKYEEGSDYCPLAWIHRLTTVPSTAKEAYLTNLQAVQDAKRSNATPNDYFTQQRDLAQTEADTVSKSAHDIIENVDPPTDAMLQACRTLNTPERLAKAHAVCSRLMDDDTWYGEMLENELNESEARRASKTKMLKQACNALFCNSADGSNEEIGKPQVCIPISGMVEVPPDQEETNPDAPYVDGGKKFFNKSVNVSFSLVLFGVFGVMFLLFLIYFLWPYVIVPTARFVYNLFARYKIRHDAISEIRANLKHT